MPGCTRRVLLLSSGVLKLAAQPARTLSSRLTDAARDSVVVLAMVDRSNKVVRTSMGFQLDESADVVGSADALRDAVKVVVATPEGRQYMVQTVLLDGAGSGLARLSAKIPEYAQHGVTMTANVATEDDRVLVPCLSRDGKRLLVEGVVSAFRSSLDFGPYYRVLLKPPPEAYLEPALPVINVAGELIGILTRRLLGKPNLFYVVPARRVPSRRDLPPALPALDKPPSSVP